MRSAQEIMIQGRSIIFIHRCRSSTSYIHGHGHGHREHNKYMYYEAILVEVLDRQEYQQELENQEES